MQYQGRLQRFVGAVVLFFSGCSGDIDAVRDGAGGSVPDSNPDPDPEGGGPPGEAPIAAECSGRDGRPGWQLSTNTAFQTRAIVAQVFGPAAMNDAQVKSMLENLPPNIRAKGFDTETKAIAGQFVDGYLALVGKLAGLAGEQSAIRNSIESYVGQDCGGTTDLSSGCGAEFARKFADAFVREPMVDADYGYIMDSYNVTKGKYQAPKAYGGFIASVLLSAKSAMRFDSAELDMQGTVDAKTIGSRLAMTLTSALPDAALRAKIEDGSILDFDIRKDEGKRLLRTPAGRATLRHFADQWLNLAGLKSPPGAAGYVATQTESALVGLAAREEIGKLFENTVIDKAGQLSDFFGTRDVVPSHDWLAKIYGTNKSNDLTPAVASDRGGILSRAAFNLYGAVGDYIPLAHRGYGIKVTMLCGIIPPLPDNVDTTLPTNAPDIMSSRQYFETLTQTGTCNGCHEIMNPYGFALADYSVTGAHLVTEKVKNRKTSQLVDVEVRADVSVLIDGGMRDVPNAAALSEVLGQSDQARACFSHRFDQYTVGRQEAFLCDGDASIALPKNDLNLEDTILAYVTSSAFSAR
ncbi:MAG: DUF1588 domain-containing protein [Deltaproteobacteria bacterium]|nr:DUF1588 domain-containing protein [Deltaproteobacteria bacterium]